MSGILKNEMDMHRLIFFFAIFLFFFVKLFSQETGTVLPQWKQGEMEIHHVHTGRGEAVFCIFPDGTTMVIDAGDSGPHSDPRTTPGFPDDSRQPGEWIARYISKRLDFRDEVKLDYFLLTHFHGDHLGGVYTNSVKTKKGGDYFLSGVTELYEHVPFSKIVDRGWPTYSYPSRLKGKAIENYLKFIEWHHGKSGTVIEGFVPGSKSQFALLKEPERYPDFEVRNIIANGIIWTGEGENTRNLFPLDLKNVHENKLCAGVRISYGAFDYFNGGDINGRLPINLEKWLDVETPVGEVLGTIEVCEANHHSWIDAMSESFLQHIQPQNIIIQVSHVSHLNLSVLQSMANKSINPNLKHIIPTNIPELSRAYLGEDQVRKMSGEGGHVVIKVDPGGDTYSIILLDSNNESMRIKSAYGPFQCR
jgi:beta-lactamase superfamily II metal-dependent hydrolase